jgi:hypothetical protein
VLACIGTLQERLEQHYDLALSARVADYVFTEATTRRALLGSGPTSREQLLIAECEGSLAISLFLDPDLLRDAEQSIDAQAAIVEGVSHFVYVVWRAERDSACTQLELELQAEVDKFLLLAPGFDDPLSAFEALFERIRLQPQLGLVERDRYLAANRAAACVCRSLLAQFDGRFQHPQAQAWLRRFYRMPAQDKLAAASSMRFG